MVEVHVTARISKTNLGQGRLVGQLVYEVQCPGVYNKALGRTVRPFLSYEWGPSSTVPDRYSGFA
jgi:hypothetical protein